jgi:hypothetical protein
VVTRLLFDENLPARLVRALAENFPGSSDVVMELGPGSLDASTDSLVELLRVSADQIAAFVEDREAAFLPIGRR